MDAPDEYAKSYICQFVGVKAFKAAEKSFNTTPEQYVLDGRAEVYGIENPSIMNKPFWKHMVYTHNCPWKCRNENKWDEDEYPEAPHVPSPMWCFDRFGRTRTELPDGRRVYIAGEYDDSYDPDFFIYNDVIVVDPRVTPFGPESVTIYGYPLDVFPATDSHTSTLYTEPGTEKQYIAIVGGQGYGGEDGPHKSTTTVYRLDLQNFSIEKSNIQEFEGPGKRLDHHRANLLETDEVKALFGDKQDGVILKVTTSTFRLNNEIEEVESALQFGWGNDTEDELESVVEELVADDVDPEPVVDADAETTMEDDLESSESSDSDEEPFVEEVYYLDLLKLRWIHP